MSSRAQTDPLRSAWLKFARGVELAKLLARLGREFPYETAHDYRRTDNASDETDPLVRMHWRLYVRTDFPERWSVLIGDILTNLRAALDHAFWAAALGHSGMPARPHVVNFPITTTERAFRRQENDLKQLVAPEVWELVDAVQPLRGGAEAYTSPLEILRWLSNLDKHRAVHVVGRTAWDLGEVLVQSDPPLKVIEQWRLDGPAEDGAVVGRLKLKRPRESQELLLMPTLAYEASVQISDDPVAYRGLGSAMEAMREMVMSILFGFADRLGAPFDPADLQLGEEHDAHASDHGGDFVMVTGEDGSIVRVPLRLPQDWEPEIPDSIDRGTLGK